MHIILCGLFRDCSFFGLLAFLLSGANRLSKTQVENSTQAESFPVHDSSLLFILFFILQQILEFYISKFIAVW